MSPADPKPPKRQPKKPKPIARKRKAKRSYKTPRCVWGRCRLPQKTIERCERHAKIHLDILRGHLIRTEVCEINHRDGRWVGTPFPCKGPIQDNHGIPRGNMRTRWVLENGLSGCAGVNIWAHHHKNDWVAYLVRHWGAEKFARLMEMSVSGPLPDYAEVLKVLSVAC